MANPYMGLAGSLARARRPPAQNDVYMQQPRGTGRPPQQYGSGSSGMFDPNKLRGPNASGFYSNDSIVRGGPQRGGGLGGVAGIDLLGGTGAFQTTMQPPQGGGFMGGMGGLMDQARGAIGGMAGGLPSGGVPGRGQGQGFFGGHDTSGGFFGGNPGTQYMGGMGGLMEQAAGTIGGMGAGLPSGGAPGRGQGQGFFGGHDTSGGFFGGNPGTQYMGGMGDALGLGGPQASLPPASGGMPYGGDARPPAFGGGPTPIPGGGGPAFGGGPSPGGATPGIHMLGRPTGMQVPGFGGGPTPGFDPTQRQTHAKPTGFGGGPLQTPLEDYQRPPMGRRFP